MKNLEEELTCSICYSIFEDPRVLPCSHTFCRNCLENVLQASGNSYIWRPLRIPLKCPNCRSRVEIPQSGIESLPVNFALRAIIEKYQQEDHPDIVTCAEHHSQPLNVYCLLDKKLVCGHCLTIGEHHGHPIGDLHSAYMKEKDTPIELFEQLTDRHWTDLNVLMEKLEQQQSHCEKIVEDDRESVLMYFNQLREILDQKKETLLSALDAVRAQIVEEYSPLLATVKEIREEQLELMLSTVALQEEESPLNFLEKLDDVRQRVQAVRQRQLPPLKPVEVQPRVGLLMKEEWSKVEIGQVNNVLIPEIKLSSREVLCNRTGDDNKEMKELLKFLTCILAVVSALATTHMLVGEHVSPISFSVSEASQSVYQMFFSSVYAIKEILCYACNSVGEFIWKMAHNRSF
ncbi:tripartite motif-containing protein 59 [Tachyglossus aculeatus]|uniref:tripartite motif-containing protein 59 n=1 Tax=Tachyglossus aculeatus TaxID=9261 RepID=UPI0018F59D9C|nr:tripartite motif-containing protein 59 [Tachyglossus aculeatus]